MFGAIHTYLLWQFWITVVTVILRFGVTAYREQINAGTVIFVLAAAYMACWEATLLGWFN